MRKVGDYEVRPIEEVSTKEIKMLQFMTIEEISKFGFDMRVVVGDQKKKLFHNSYMRSGSCEHSVNPWDKKAVMTIFSFWLDMLCLDSGSITISEEAKKTRLWKKWDKYFSNKKNLWVWFLSKLKKFALWIFEIL